MMGAPFTNVLSILVIGILVISLISTWYLARRQKALEGEIDSGLAKPIQKHVYLKNPVFFSYGLFFVLLLVIILFVAMIF